jgi:hypothetical protein
MEEEIAHLRSPDLIGLQSRWQSVVERRPPSEHVPNICCSAVSPIAFRSMSLEISMLRRFNF